MSTAAEQERHSSLDAGLEPRPPDIHVVTAVALALLGGERTPLTDIGLTDIGRHPLKLTLSVCRVPGVLPTIGAKIRGGDGGIAQEARAGLAEPCLVSGDIGRQDLDALDQVIVRLPQAYLDRLV